MRVLFRSVLAAIVLAGSAFATASAHEAEGGGRAVFVQSNDPATNQVIAYRRGNNGALTQVASYATGGQGGNLKGAAIDPLASQGSLQFDAAHDLLIGVNAGSDSVYAFSVEGDKLSDRQVISSGGVFPVSIATHEDLVYVLNARASGSVHGYRISEDGVLKSIPNSTRSLNLTPGPDPSKEFVMTPGQVGFTPDGRHLIVTTKANGSNIDVFQVNEDGRLSAKPVANVSQTPVPFAFTFDAQRQLVVAEAGSSNVSTYRVGQGGTLSPVATATDAQAALCWIARAKDKYLVANAGSGTVSSFRIDAGGQPILEKNNPVGAGPIDMSVARGGQFLYVQLGGSGSVAALRINSDGSLTPIGTVAGHIGEEGIVAL
jgi:6-phosphogluconolactonase (cycloisomerase 2 family)